MAVATPMLYSPFCLTPHVALFFLLHPAVHLIGSDDSIMPFEDDTGERTPMVLGPKSKLVILLSAALEYLLNSFCLTPLPPLS